MFGKILSKCLVIIKKHIFLVNIKTLFFRPCIGDFSVHGSIYAHLLRDPVPGKVTKTKAPLVAGWCERMAGHVHQSRVRKL